MKRDIKTKLACGNRATAYRSSGEKVWWINAPGVRVAVRADSANIRSIIRFLRELEVNTPGNRRKPEE